MMNAECAGLETKLSRVLLHSVLSTCARNEITSEASVLSSMIADWRYNDK